MCSVQEYESKLEALQKQVDRCLPDATEEEEEPEEEGSAALKLVVSVEFSRL